MYIALALAHTAILLYIAWTDLRTRRIPNVVIGPALLAALLALPWTVGVWPGLLGALFAALPLVIARRLAGARRVGMGDVKLALFIGLTLGHPLALASVVLALSLALAAGLVGMARGAWTWRTQLPFGPFLAAGALTLVGWTIYG
jgi:prepilin signal peptidase PulO-like enzyme (type II secretory pathway)